MKFHHLARHNQFSASQAQHRDLSPAKQQDHQLQETSISNNMNNLSDDEEEEFSNEVRGYYDVIDQQQQQQQHQFLQNQHQQQANQPANLDTSGFLMDKNKKLFPQKLWELIHNPSIQHCLRWSQDGQRVYLNRNEFEAYYLKTPNNQFHTQKAISFVRQMNMYGFRKVDDCYYENDNFRRDRQHLLRNMIRRHPNKGLFVGLDQHQLAAAAAAQQAMQVNQQLQQLEHQHKHRTEQALRLNSYLNNHHQFHQSALAHGHTNHQLSNSSPFEHMSSQLAQAAANHLNQQQLQHQQHQLQQQQHQQQKHESQSAISSTNLSNKTLINGQHQPKKSRLLNNFYASAAPNNTNNANKLSVYSDNNPASQLLHNQDSMHSNSSLDTQPSQSSSVVNSGSAGSPQPSSPSVLQQRLAALTSQRLNQTSSSAIRASVLATQDPVMIQNGAGKFPAKSDVQQAAADLSNQSLATRQALHQTLVRSLLQLKQQHPHDLLASLQHQSPRSILESLASLSSAGTGSIVDPTSNSPTERTSTPPSSPPSPPIERDTKFEESKYLDSSNIALDLAKSSTNFILKRELDVSDDIEHDIDIVDENRMEADRRVLSETEIGENSVDAIADSPLDGPKKVRRFLDTQMSQQKHGIENGNTRASFDPDFEDKLPRKKKLKLSSNNSNNIDNENDESYCNSIIRSLVVEICERKGDRLDMAAIQEAARYTGCFLEILLEDAALIARHSTSASELADEGELKSKIDGKDSRRGLVDVSSLSLALKLIPSKLLAAIQQNVNVRQT